MAIQSKQLEKIVNTIVSVGAAVVIFGAWAKILHKSYADVMLTVGLLTEAAIFLLYAFMPPAGGEMAEVAEALKKGAVGAGSSTNDELKKLIEQEINPDNLKKLNESFARFNTTIQNLGTVANVSEVTNDFAAKTKEASAALTMMKDAYANAAASVQHFNHAAESSKAFQEQMQTLTNNLSALNKMYESEVKESGGHITVMNAFYENLNKTAQAMQGSVEDAKKTQEQIALLSKNLGSLNSVYGNMLAAMQGRG